MNIRAFTEQINSPQGAILATRMLISQSLLDDPLFDVTPYIKKQNEDAARRAYPDLAYQYLTPDEYEYSPGPFAFDHTPGDLPPGIVLMVGRVRVTQKDTP